MYRGGSDLTGYALHVLPTKRVLPLQKSRDSAGYAIPIN
jgi:hypothetical protein